ncbi:uncharacterized protein LOC111066937 [Drosophila obscura]|uniref:uncharacterized protein LOC111066937 n=1 Tax=Drosophila obscura TaxID=7282 RepID=UPI000BA16D90|nr:uncharacterized protein LOC111066937 [Drosophila obscura]
MSNPCQCHVWHADIDTITQSAESDDKKNEMFADLSRCVCCAENRMLRTKLARCEATIANLELFVNTMMTKQENIFKHIDKLRQFRDYIDEELAEDVPVENPGQSGDDHDSLANVNVEDDGEWEVPGTCMCVPTSSQPLPSEAATSQSSSESDGDDDFLETLYIERPSDTESDDN